MISYLLKLLSLFVFALFVILQYYGISFHNEASTGYLTYAITLAILYGIYKTYWITSGKQKVTFSPLTIGLYTLLHVLVLSFVFFGLSGGTNGGFVLFFKIFGYCLLPFSIVIISYSFACKAIEKLLPSFREKETSFRFLTSLGLGMTSFLTFLAVLSVIGFYNIWSIFGILAVFVAFSWDELFRSLRALWSYRFELPNHKGNGTLLEQINLPLLSTEFLFLFITFLTSVNFINIVRPMPIGWDDLGVYMNFPQTFANNGSILKWVGMMAWQIFTGIGFMFHSAPQAFFMNELGGVLSLIVVSLALGSLLKSPLSDGEDKKRSLVNLPLLGAAMFYSMPMVIFQQAKDMKLDPGLFFVSVIAVYGFLHLLLEYKKKLDYTVIPAVVGISTTSSWDSRSSREWRDGIANFLGHHEYLAYIFLFGLIAGLAFAIKFTSLMLVLGIIGLIFFAKLWLAGFFGYFALFVALFTKLWLWSQLNVSYPKDDNTLLQSVFIGALIGAIILLGYAWKKYGTQAYKGLSAVILVFLVALVLPLSPWLVKNISETGLWNISVTNLLSGKGETFEADLSKLYSPSELKAIEDRFTADAISSSGKAQNEDLGRYFGYEDGANNYLKLPLNLTMQSNQSGEYTEITYFYLALIPVIFLFLAFHNPLWIIGLAISILFEIAYFFLPGASSVISSFFATQNLPKGYVSIALLSFLPLVYFAFALKNDRKSELFKLNLAFASMYVFIFVIAAYGIVWYGITMYFSFLLAIIIGAWHLSSTENNEESKENIVRLFGSFVFLILVSVYFFASSIPHGWNNLKSAGFTEFKAGVLSQEEGIFTSHPDYFSILAMLNLQDEKAAYDAAIASIKNETLKKLIEANIGKDMSLKRLEQILREISQTDLQKLGLDPAATLELQMESKNILGNLYETVLYPPKSIRNTAGIYRIGTFLTYFISNNQTRYYDDSLVTNFWKYFYDQNPDTAIARMEKIGLKYLLVDLNAATIDKDPRHDLTRRYENLIRSFQSKKLELVQTDSPCLQVALEEKDPKTYMTYAGVNYESYEKDTSGKEITINRGQKQFACYNHILELVQNNKIDTTHYSQLLPLANYLKQNPPKNQQEMIQVFQNYVGHGWLALFRIK